ncbi:MAG: hypothetical protein Q9221_002907 [Calogaya cf. arnoldii]
MENSSSTSNVPLLAVPGPFMGFINEVVTVLVGPDETPFHIHKGLLCSKSEYFRAAFEGSFKEAKEGKIHLKDEEPESFQYYAMWIYNSKLDLLAAANTTRLDVNDYCRLYMLAEKFGSHTLQNLAIDRIHEHERPSFDLDVPTVTQVYKHTLPGSRLRKTLVELQAYDYDLGSGDEDENPFAGAPSEFLFEVAMLCIRRLPYRLPNEVAPFEQDYCKGYHTHKGGEVCPSRPASGAESDAETDS